MNKSDRHNDDMYKLYESYRETLKQCKKPLLKRQKINAELREEYGLPYSRQDYNLNKNDISVWNSMIRELEEDMKDIEMYLDFDDRVLLHRDYDNTKSLIYNQNSYEGIVPLEGLYEECVPDTTNIVCDVELQEEIVGLLEDVLTERQRQVIHLYFWEKKTQEKIANELGIDKSNVNRTIQNSLEIIRNSIDDDYLKSLYQ